MNVLFLSYDGLTDPLGQSQILPYILGLANSGYNYSVLSFEKKDRFKAQYEPINRDLKKAGIFWIAFPYTKKPPVLSTLHDILSMRREIINNIELCPIDVLHCRSYITMFAAYPIARKHNIKLIFDMRGFWIDERVEGRIWNIKNPVFNLLYLYLKKKEKLWMRNADLVISLTEKGKYVIRKNFNRAENLPIEVIPCCADEYHFKKELISEQIRSEKKKNLKIERGNKILGYVGSIGTWYMAREMMVQFKRLYKNDIVDKFLWITPENKEYIYKLAAKEGVKAERIIVVSSNRSEIPANLSLIDIGIFYIKPTFSKSASSPTKMAEMLLMGIPIICNSNIGDLDHFMLNHPVGICHDVYSPESLKIEDVIKLKELNSDQIRNIGEKYLGLKSGILKYQNALNLLK